MALRQALGASSGELMREDAIPCGRMTRIFSTVAGVGGVFLSWPLCSIHYGWSRTLHRDYCRIASGGIEVSYNSLACAGDYNSSRFEYCELSMIPKNVLETFISFCCSLTLVLRECGL
jgi:hypothetical protein